ncbi:MAG: 50S ribosomal protein L29 [Deltaproteobacteria bacterium]|nr:50S ribosomal protein L29 [Deltaproteobacteria bacterium]
MKKKEEKVDYHKLALTELQPKLKEAKQKVAKLRLEIMGGGIKNCRGLRFAKRDLARVLTIIAMKQKQEQKQKDSVSEEGGTSGREKP